MYVGMYVYMYVCMYACIYACMNVCMYKVEDNTRCYPSALSYLNLAAKPQGSPCLCLTISRLTSAHHTTWL